jgi:protein phosphatase
VTPVTLHAALSDIGLQRRTNEDSYVAAPPLFAVCDGMGGAEAGEVASALAAETLAARFAAGDGIAAAARAANAAVHARAGERREESGMGTTLTAVVVDDEEGHFAHVGDSRAYRLRGEKLELLSDDHSLVGEMVREGRLTREEAAVHPHRSILSRALGTEADVEVDEFSAGLRPGDVLLLCSDGLSGEVGDDVIRELLAAEDPADAARGLVDAALAAGGHDNVTAVVIRIVAGDEGAAGVQEATTQVLTAPGDGGEDEPAIPGGTPGGPPGATAVGADAHAGRAATPRAKRRLLVTLVVVLALVALLGVVGVVVVNTCYFVGVDDGRLVVYSGLPWSVGPLGLHSVYLRSTRPYAYLDSQQRALVDARSVRSKDGALRLAADLGMIP